MADGDTRGDGCDEYSASVRNSLSFLKFLFFFQKIKKKNSHAVFPHRNSSFFLFFLFLSYIHVTFGIPRRSAFTSQENVSPSWASITFAFFNPSSPTAFCLNGRLKQLPVRRQEQLQRLHLQHHRLRFFP